MLELKNVTKVYTGKGGAVKALDDVSLRFPEKGLVFLLGKSGSGKSTLLHIAGGLDSPTEGEIVVLGKSSKDFTESDYDGYRNAYVGFIFQEYNVLDEFTVEENIALALQLQGKPQTKEKIAVILREVDLLSLADRKPNTLSGGQKQRVAIARALVKDPKIVLADEPTGALDSQTGKQVFEILKKLARERLVIVVSHDREFAEAYADRIIELKDGRICADRTREKAPVDREDTVTEADEDTLLIRSGKEISPETLQRIEHFIREGDELVLLRGKRNILDFKRSRRISPNGTQERFLPTPPAEDMPTESEAAAGFLPSRLPFRKAFRLGASGLKGRPFRLALTILLSVVAFVAFGLFSTVMLYDENAVLRASFLSSDTEYLTLEKTYRSTVSYKIWGTPNSYETSASALFTPSELSSFGGERALGAFAWNVIPENTVLSEKAVYWSCHIQNAVYVPEGHTLRSRILAGRYPEAENEICVSSYFYESCKAGEVFPLEENGSLSDKGVTLGEPDDLLGQELLLNGQRYVVSGVFDSGTIPEKFEALLASDAYDSLYYALRTFTREGLQGAALISETAAADFREALRSSAPSGNDPFDTSGLRYYLSPFPSEEEQELWAVDRFQIADEQIPYKTYCLLDTSTLADDQFIAPLSFVARLCRALAENGTQELAALSDSLTQLETAPPAEQKTLLEKTMALWRSYGELSVPLLKEVFDEKTEQPGLEDLGSYAVVGFYLEENDGFFCSEQFYEGLTISRTAQKITSAYTPEEDALYQYAFLLMPHNEGELKGIFDRLDGVDTRDVSYGLVNALASTVESVGHTVETLSLVFLVIGLIFMTFAALLLLNFIIISIAGKQREIGILRAVGARGLDVFKIFFAESGILVGSCLVFSLFGTAIAAVVLNHILKEQLGLAVSVFLVGPLSVLLMAAVAAAVALLGTIFPVFFAARKKPVDTIRSL